VPANGAARVEAEGTLFTTVEFTSVGLNWLTIELNPQIEPGGDTGTFFLTAIDDDGDVFTSASFTLGNGENRVSAQAINGQSITALLLTASGPLVHDVPPGPDHARRCCSCSGALVDHSARPGRSWPPERLLGSPSQRVRALFR